MRIEDNMKGEMRIRKVKWEYGRWNENMKGEMRIWEVKWEYEYERWNGMKWTC